jgi:integrase
MSRPRKPKRPPGLRWIYAQWREKTQRWEWAPARKIDGRLVWLGPSNVDPEAAFAVAKNHESVRAIVAKVGETTLSQACDRAVLRLLADGGSEYTAKGYRARFGRWFEILSRDALVTELTADDVEHLKAERRAKHGIGNNTIRTDLVVLQRVLDLAGLAGERNPVRGVSRPKVAEPHRPHFTMAEVRAIARRIRASKLPGAEWHATVIVFLAMTGARAHEIERLRREHVVPGKDGVQVVLHGVKGGKHVARSVFVASGFRSVAERFVRDAKEGPPLAPSTIATICKRWADTLGEPRLSGRVLRRSYATATSFHVPIQYVQSLLGHSQLTTTQKYLGIDPRPGHAAAARLHSELAGRAPRKRRAPARSPRSGSPTQGTPATPPDSRREPETPSSAHPSSPAASLEGDAPAPPESSPAT